MRFSEKLKSRQERAGSMVCVGLDPDLNKLPEVVKDKQYPIFKFNKAIIDATHDLVLAYKPQNAFYAGQSAEKELEMTTNYIRENHPYIPVILDAKRSDIGNTAKMYVKEAFERYNVDAVTVDPYIGHDSVLPFLEREDKGAIVLCKTSNPGSSEFQSLVIEGTNGKMLYQIVAEKAQNEWNENNNVMLVVGATQPEEMKIIREIAPDLTFLVPGVGAQGGSVEKVIESGINKNGTGLIINSSRGIIYASSEPDFAEASRKKTLELKDEINKAKEIVLNRRK